jgi:hypothetical protein
MYLIQDKEAIEKRILAFTSRREDASICRTNILDKNGINYRDFIKLRADVVINNKIGIIGHEAWLILFYLSCHAENKEYIKTNIRLISSELGISSIDKALRALHDNGLIYIKNLEGDINKLGKNDILEVIIRYNNDDLFQVDKKAYKALPTQYVRYLIQQEKLTSEEFAIYTVLVNYFRWFECKNEKDEETDTINYYYSSYEYAFPTQEQIGQAIGISRNRVHYIIESLAGKKLISYEASDFQKSSRYEEGRNVIKNPNYRYKIELLQRLEFVHFNYLAIKDARNKAERDFVEQKGFETIACSRDQGILKDRDYLLHKYGNMSKMFNEALKSGNVKYYTSTPSNSIGIIERFNNKSIEKVTKKAESERIHREKLAREKSELSKIWTTQKYDGEALDEVYGIFGFE